MVINIKKKKTIIFFMLLYSLCTIRIFKYDTFIYIKQIFVEEVNIIKLSQEFFGRFHFIYFSDNDIFVSNNDEVTSLGNGFYFIKTDTTQLLSKTDGIVMNLEKKDGNYIITIQNDMYTTIYYNIEEVNVNLYEYIKQQDCLGTINYEYMVKYEN